MNQLSTRSEADEIIAYLQHADPDSVRLSKKLQEKLERLNHCEGLIRTYGSRIKVGPMLMKKFGISKQTAYRDFEDCQLVFGTTKRSSKEFWLDVLMGKMMESRNNAVIDRDWNAVARIEKNMKDLIKELAGDQKTLPFDKVQPAPVMIGFFPEMTKVTLPDDWEAQIKKMQQPKRKADHIQEAEIVEENGEE